MSGNGYRNRVEVVMTAEPRPDGYAQHRVTVERGNADSVQVLDLTDLELLQLAAVLTDYQGGVSAVTTRFADHSGRG